MFNNLLGHRKNAVGLTTENNMEAKNKKVEDVQKESTLQPLIKASSKLDNG
jgi:hypothetical protein